MACEDHPTMISSSRTGPYIALTLLIATLNAGPSLVQHATSGSLAGAVSGSDARVQAGAGDRCPP